VTVRNGNETDDVLKVPNWVPKPVLHLAHLMHKDVTKHPADGESIELLRRLTCDPRMKRVWNELLRRQRTNYRTTDAFVHPARSRPKTFWTPEARAHLRRGDLIRSLGGDERTAAIKPDSLALLAEFAGTACLLPGYEGPLDDQQRALAFLFHQVFTLARHKPRAVSQTDARAERNQYFEMAKQIITDNTEWRRLRGYSDERLARAASAYLERADEVAPGPASPLLVNRKHGRNESIKGFVLELAATTKNIFGASLLRTVATLTHVALGREDITTGQVRAMVASHTLPLKGDPEFF
jgi:hypothetical protein